MCVISMIDTVDKDALVGPIEKRLGVETLAAVIMKFKGDDVNSYDEMVSALAGTGSYNFAPNKLELDLKNRVSLSAKPSIEEPTVLVLKALPTHLRYAFLGVNITLSIIIAADLVNWQVEALVFMLQKFKRVIGWSTANIIGILPGICTHKIQLEPDCVHSIEHQQRLKSAYARGSEEGNYQVVGCGGGLPLLPTANR